MPDKMMRVAGRGKDGEAKAISTNLDGEQLQESVKNNVLLTSVLNVEVAAGATRTLAIGQVDLTDYDQLYVIIRASGFHNFNFDVQFGTKQNNTFGQTLTGRIRILQARDSDRMTSDLVDVVGDTISFAYLQNNDSTNTLNYDVFIYGRKNPKSNYVEGVMPIEKSSSKITGVSATTRLIVAPANAFNIGVFVESGSVRVVSNGDAATSTTGIPLGFGHYMFWKAKSVSLYFEQDSTVTVVYQ